MRDKLLISNNRGKIKPALHCQLVEYSQMKMPAMIGLVDAFFPPAQLMKILCGDTGTLKLSY